MAYLNFRYDVDEDGIVLLAWDMPDRSMNVFTQQVIDELTLIVDRVITDQAVKGVVFTSLKESFSAGADLVMLHSLMQNYAAEKRVNEEKAARTLFEMAGQMTWLFRKIETCGKAWVAAINGLCMGGAFELALSCHVRLVSDHPKVKLALPEVKVGLFPGAGGTQRVPRLCALDDALQLMRTGENLTTERALSLGLVHEIVAADQLIMVAKQKLNAGIDPIAPWDKAGGDSQQEGIGANDTLPNRAALVTCVNEGLPLPFDQALRVEQRHFAHLLAQPATRMMVRSLFISPQELNKGARRPRYIEAQKLNKIAIIGVNEAIAHASAQAGLSVVVISSDYTQLHECDLAIEAVCDDLALKQNVIEKANHFMPDHAILLSTTSGLAEVLPHSHNCVAIHFCNETVVEIIKEKHTSDQAVAVAFDYARLIKKTPLIIKDAPGLYINRCRERYIAEARHMLGEGVPRVMIDAAAKMAGLPIEPLLNIKHTNVAVQNLDVHELCLRFLTALALEAARVMEEGVVIDPREADVGSILAFGFPSFTGGVLSYIDGMGAAAFVAQCERLQQKFGARFEPNALLCDMARKNSGFYQTTA